MTPNQLSRMDLKGYFSTGDAIRSLSPTFTGVTVAIPIWVKHGINAWMTAAGIEDGRLLRSISKSGKINRDTLSDWAVWSVVEQSSKQIGIEHFGAHDLRRTCAKLCRKNGGDLEQIKFLLGHSSIQTTERYLGSEQEIEIAVNDNLGL